MVQDRLQKIFSKTGFCSRREAERLLEEGQVTVNGITASVGDKADLDKDSIQVKGIPLSKEIHFRVILLNKPVGVISSCSDSYGRTTVLDLLPKRISKGLYPIGRLDLDSRGAILLTNHGELTLQLTHPRYFHPKTYKVWVEGIPSTNKLDRWRNGIVLDNKITMKAYVTLIKSTTNRSLLKVILKEGRNRQIRRIAEEIGHPVVDLQRTCISHLELNELEEGSWREVPKVEWLKILNANKP